MSSTALVTAINKTIFAVSNDDLRPAMTGVFFELDKKSITFVATDAHRLVRFTRSDVKMSAEAPFHRSEKAAEPPQIGAARQ